MPPETRGPKLAPAPSQAARPDSLAVAGASVDRSLSLDRVAEKLVQGIFGAEHAAAIKNKARKTSSSIIDSGNADQGLKDIFP